MSDFVKKKWGNEFNLKMIKYIFYENYDCLCVFNGSYVFGIGNGQQVKPCVCV